LLDLDEGQLALSQGVMLEQQELPIKKISRLPKPKRLIIPKLNSVLGKDIVVLSFQKEQLTSKISKLKKPMIFVKRRCGREDKRRE
jgi:hypothetical protein